LFEVFTTGQLRKDLSPTYGVRGIWRFERQTFGKAPPFT
jgi:hypothetical protein